MMKPIRETIIYSVFFLSFLLNSCNIKSGSESFNFERDTPSWLKEKIDSILNSSDHYYDLAKVYRYNWNETFIYHFSIPMSSCMYCELYDQSGMKASANYDTTLQSVLKNKKNEVLIWENKK